VQFGSYAKFRIRGAILDSLREMDWGPRELRRKARKVEEAHRKLSLELSRAPTENEVAAEMGMTLQELQHLLGELDSLEVGSLRIESPWDGKEEDLCDYLPNANEDTPFFRCLRSEMKDLLARVIGELPEKEQQVLSLYYFEELTMKEVGAVLGIGESRVSQIHSLAVVRLRSRLSEMMSAGGGARARRCQRCGCLRDRIAEPPGVQKLPDPRIQQRSRARSKDREIENRESRIEKHGKSSQSGRNRCHGAAGALGRPVRRRIAVPAAG
jgi:RNA polymerase sigma factor for flagellar operon FliA